VLLPQVEVNVRVPDKNAAIAHPAVLAAVEAASRRAGREGRVLLRPSGTEPLVRVMVEGRDLEAITADARLIAAAIEAASGLARNGIGD
jgi:phosphoglucosamine mutase